MKTNIIYSLIIVLFATSCTKGLLDVKNENSYDGDTFFASPAAYNEAVTAAYSTLIHPGMYAREYYFIFDLLGNEATPNKQLYADLSVFSSYTHSPYNVNTGFLFNSSYKTVLRTNFVLDLMSKWDAVTDEDKALKKRLTGEVQFLKSFAYFNLVTNFGDVPLKRTYSDHENYHQARTDKAEIWTSIEEDLKLAISNLPESYPNPEDYGRVTSGAATALLGKSYLYQEKYTEVITELNKLVGGRYQLADSLDHIFVRGEHTPETIFAVMHSFGDGNSQDYMFQGQELWSPGATHSGREFEYGFLGWNNALISENLVDAFTYDLESTSDYVDPRSAMTFYGKTKGGDTEYNGNEYELNVFNWRKYTRYDFLDIDENSSTINSQVIRYADVLLMLAEANIKGGNISAAMGYINEVRKRSGATEYTTLGGKPMEALQRERHIELAGEQSRFSDLVRWGILENTINAEKGEIIVDEKHNLLPIPNAEIISNPAVTVKNNWN